MIGYESPEMSWIRHCEELDAEREHELEHGRCGLCVNCTTPTRRFLEEINISYCGIGYCEEVDDFVSVEWNPVDMGCEEVYETR